jgi:hypothetical protein
MNRRRKEEGTERREEYEGWKRRIQTDEMNKRRKEEGTERREE